MSSLVRTLAYVWAAPTSLVGLALGLPALALGARPRWVDGNVELCGGAFGRWWMSLPFLGRFGAITLGHVILAVGPEAMAACRAHEQVHVRQCERWGPIFLPAYLFSSLWQILRGRSAYAANHFERQAYAHPPPLPERTPTWR